MTVNRKYISPQRAQRPKRKKNSDQVQFFDLHFLCALCALCGESLRWLTGRLYDPPEHEPELGRLQPERRILRDRQTANSDALDRSAGRAESYSSARLLVRVYDGAACRRCRSETSRTPF